MIFALLPAAGQSVRMGRAKLALPLAGRTVLENVIDSLRAGSVQHVLVVLGPHNAELAPRAEAAGALVHILETATPEMRATVEHGLRWLEERFHPAPEDSWLLVPADHPLLQSEVVYQLIQTAKPDPTHSIFIPTYKGKRGHPPLIRWQHVEGLRALPEDHGLNVYLRQQTEQTREVPVDSEDILFDLDTPEDYHRIRKKYDRAPQWVTLVVSLLLAALLAGLAWYLGASTDTVMLLSIAGFVIGVLGTVKAWSLINPLDSFIANITTVTALGTGFGGFIGTWAGFKSGGHVALGAILGSVIFGGGGFVFALLVVCLQRLGLPSYRTTEKPAPEQPSQP
jgi:molybdenum cofactor cytidylyltransferase